jgi:ABC-2 type transport system permease protein
MGLVGIPVETASSREKGVLRRYRATPMRPLTYFLASVTVNLLMALTGMVLLIVLGKILYGLRFNGNWWSVLAGFMLSALAFFAVGYVIASLAPTSRMAQVIGQVSYFPMMFLSGAAMPREIMPEAVRQVSDVLPLTQVVTLLQGLWMGEAWSEQLTAVIFLLVLLVGGALVSSRVFRWE